MLFQTFFYIYTEMSKIFLRQSEELALKRKFFLIGGGTLLIKSSMSDLPDKTLLHVLMNILCALPWLTDVLFSHIPNKV